MSTLGSAWRTSTRSGDNGACVEARRTGDAVEIRDSKDRTGPTLRFTAESWRTFLTHLKASAP
jgi:hypothetical protein